MLRQNNKMALKSFSSSRSMLRLGSMLLMICFLMCIAPVSASFWSQFSTTQEEDTSAFLASPIVNREIETLVTAPWPTGPHNVLCEAMAFLSNGNENGNAFVEQLVASQTVLDGKSSFPEATELASRLAAAASASLVNNIPLLEYALAMRAKAPTCELHRTLAVSHLEKLSSSDNLEESEAFVVIAGRNENPAIVVTSLDELEQSLQKVSAPNNNPLLLLPNESPISQNSDRANEEPSVVLYATLGTPSFLQWFTKLKSLEQYPFVVRHYLPPKFQTSQYTMLQGYGVRLDIRNLEYKVFDDDKGQNKGDDDATSLINVTGLETILPHSLAGVNLTKLQAEGVEMNPALQEALWKQHEAQHTQSELVPPTWQRRQLSLQAAVAIISSQKNNNDPLVTLQDIAQNLPSVASTLVHVTVPEPLSQLVEAIERPLQQFQGLYVNGRPISIERPSFNVFELIQLLQTEHAALQELQQTLGPYVPQNMLPIIQKDAWMQGASFGQEENDGTTGGSSSTTTTTYRIDVGRGGKGAIVYLNDIEQDDMYAGWSRNPQQMLMAMQYGMPPSLRRNVFTLLAVLDPTTIASSEGSGHTTLELALQLVRGQYPARLGVLIVSQADMDACKEWITTDGGSEKGTPCPVEGPLFGSKQVTTEYLQQTPVTARLIHTLVTFVLQTHSSQIAMAYVPYLENALQGKLQESADSSSLSMMDLLEVHGQLLQQFRISAKSGSEIIQELAAFSTETYDYGKAVRFAIDKGLTQGMGFLNGVPLPVASSSDGEDYGEVMERLGDVFHEEQNHIFKMIMEGELTESTPRNLYAKLLSGSNVFPRVHPLLVGAKTGEDSHLELPHSLSTETLLYPESTNARPNLADAVFTVEGFFALDTPEGLESAASFVETMASFQPDDSDSKMAVAYRILPTSPSPAICSVLSNAGILGHRSLLDVLKSLQAEEGGDASPDACETLEYLLEDSTKSLPSNFLSVNGRFYELALGQKVEKVDIDLLLSMEMGRTKATTELFRNNLGTDDNNLAWFEAVGRTASFLATASKKSSRRMNTELLIKEMNEEAGLDLSPLHFTWNQDSTGQSLDVAITAVVDPVSETAQRMSPLLTVIRDHLKLPLSVYLAPTSILDGDSKIPISSYYRFVSGPTLFQDGPSSPMASFAHLPSSHTLTMRMDVPEPWDIQQSKSVQDTDNLRCDLQAGCSDDDQNMISRSDEAIHGRRHLTSVEYSLKSLLFFGQCYETKGSSPNGLQLTLTTSSSSDKEDVYSDTLVMKNVGYWQLRANPGVWNLNIKENSRGAEIFDMVEGKVSHNAIKVTGELPSNATKPLVMGDFVSRSEMLLVRRREGYERATLFYEKDKSVADEEVINVFSLATGHLYERFLKIMMLSVTKRTSTKVKFWLFENYLSPAFKSSARAMAEQIGCEVEFVTYKWPEWLRGQSEKQRIIWGYKILFLDVLFPLDVKKIIYVDADQVIRGDLKELWDLDLQGAPYGYVPMCSSRESTLGYQFWNTGFWESHLRGKPYHISALYVVDLQRFRKTLVGDQLRSIYQSLSADPNSLANLDQDLPNYAQHQVPIFSLPQEWLWCESWCSDETKAAAKTIDLCNNPLHKEPKVSMAKRIISGSLFNESWVDLDAEVEGYETQFFESVATE